ncbi:MAG: hypothetical protein INQ03_06640 [Candidatus Heimdallarchaeota archaeon]|nr:hypothetical protein [Candidatus Heimdallarchaeota archaeon]
MAKEMDLSIPELSSRHLRVVLQSRDLAQLGDFLINFIYSTVRVGIKGVSGGVHVWDYSLRLAMEETGLRSHLGQRTKPDKVSDAAEALIAYAFYTDLIALENMMVIIGDKLDITQLDGRKQEKYACSVAISHLLRAITAKATQEDRFDSSE